jgi:hypothetical protein
MHPKRILFDIPIIERPDVSFEIPCKKNGNGYYELLPNKNFIGGKNSLRNLAASKVSIGFIYLIRIQGTNKCKIGVSTNPKRRLSDISSVLPFELDILALNQINNPYVFEQELLDLFKHKAIKNEWFELSLHDMEYIMVTLHNRQVKESIYGKA